MYALDLGRLKEEDCPLLLIRHEGPRIAKTWPSVAAFLDVLLARLEKKLSRWQRELLYRKQRHLARQGRNGRLAEEKRHGTMHCYASSTSRAAAVSMAEPRATA